MITWERGAGVTLACGTGATSTAISGYKLGLFDENVLLHLPGGDLKFNVYEKEDKLDELKEAKNNAIKKNNNYRKVNYKRRPQQKK